MDDSSKQLFDSLIEKLDKIRIANEENAARKQQRLVGRNRANKSRAYAPSISYLTEDNNRSNEKETTTSSTQDEVITKVSFRTSSLFVYLLIDFLFSSNH